MLALSGWLFIVKGFLSGQLKQVFSQLSLRANSYSNLWVGVQQDQFYPLLRYLFSLSCPPPARDGVTIKILWWRCLLHWSALNPIFSYFSYSCWLKLNLNHQTVRLTWGDEYWSSLWQILMSILFWLPDLSCNLEDAGIGVFWWHCAAWEWGETKHGSSSQDASQSASKNTGVVLVPYPWKCIPKAIFGGVDNTLVVNPGF